MTGVTDSNRQDAVFAFFMSTTNNAAAARSLTEALNLAAKDLNVDVMELLNEFTNRTELEINAIMAAIINRTRRNTSLLGVKQPRQTNRYVARNIKV